jgi:phosphate transport system substrate-binding protein
MRFAKYLKLLLFIAGFCFSSAATAGDQRLILTGSSTVAPLALEMAKRFEQAAPRAV